MNDSTSNFFIAYLRVPANEITHNAAIRYSQSRRRLISTLDVIEYKTKTAYLTVLGKWHKTDWNNNWLRTWFYPGTKKECLSSIVLLRLKRPEWCWINEFLSPAIHSLCPMGEAFIGVIRCDQCHVPCVSGWSYLVTCQCHNQWNSILLQAYSLSGVHCHCHSILKFS